MEVIVLKNSRRGGKRGLGNIGDVINVKKGYARNYLVPQGFACYATPEALEEVESRRAEFVQHAADELSAAQKLGGKVAGLTLQIVQRASVDGSLFGSVTKDIIAVELAKQGFEIDKTQVILPEGGFIKRTGDYAVSVELHPEVAVEVTVSILGEHA